MKYVLWVLLAALAVVCAILLVVIFCILAGGLTSDPKKEYASETKFHRFCMNVIAWFLVVFGGITVKVNGREKIPQDRRFLFVANHRSNYDPIVALYAMPKQKLIFVSKPSNFNIPFIGRLVHRCRFLPIDREDPRKAITTINKAAEILKEDTVSMGIYPEGTRSKDCTLLPFHDGVLKIAQKAKAPILVTTVQGTEMIHKNFPFKRTTVIINILDLIEEPETYKTSVLSAKVREEIEGDLSK